MKKILNIITATLLIIFISISIIFIFKYTNTHKKYEKLNERYDNQKNVLEETQNLFSLLQTDYENLEKEYNDLVNEYNELVDEYNILSEEYSELEILYNAETEVKYEQPSDLSEYATDITYNDLARTPDDYEGKALCLSGEVVQLIEDSEENQIRLAVDGDYDQMILIGYDPSIVDERILEDDYITIYGISIGIYTYESTLGGMISVPAVWVEYIEMD